MEALNLGTSSKRIIVFARSKLIAY